MMCVRIRNFGAGRPLGSAIEGSGFRAEGLSGGQEHFAAGTLELPLAIIE